MVAAGKVWTMTPRVMHGPGPGFSPPRLAVVLARLPPMRHLWVAFSGGADSLALLHALSALRERLVPTTIGAVHVHHGLHEHADAWVNDCRRMCARLDVPLEVLRVDATAERGESPEAAARRARYRALAALLETREGVCTAHHRRDQAETLLLQLVRGAGPAGLAAMPALAALGKGWLVRPLLDWSPNDLREYLQCHAIEWSEDPSNADRRFDRNYLRHEIVPRLENRWPGVQRTLARAAAHQADSAAIADELAGIDLARARGRHEGTLSTSALARRRLPMAGASHLDKILEEVVGARKDAEPLVRWPGAEVRRYRDALYASMPLPAHDAARVVAWEPPGTLELAHGALEAVPAEGRGVSVECCRGARLEVRFRRGGERFRPAGRRHSTTLKKLLQVSGVPPWLRERIPLLYVDGEFAAVAGLSVAHAFAAADGGAGWVTRWTALPDECA